MQVDAARILAVLPQTQCTRCGYPDCGAYAQAIAGAQAPINQCPPGGAQGIQRLAQLTGQPVLALNDDNGLETSRAVAFIDEAWCIGCTLCIKACPVDAIVGVNKRMHTVIEAACTGCELCIPACPVDCIVLENASGDTTGWNAWSQQQADQARDRYQFSQQRRQQEDAAVGHQDRLPANSGSVDPIDLERAVDAPTSTRKQQIIAAAQARAKARRPD